MSTNAPTKTDPFLAYDTFETDQGPVGIYRLSKLEELGLTKVDALHGIDKKQPLGIVVVTDGLAVVPIVFVAAS